MVFGRHRISSEAEARYAADVELSGRFPERLEAARQAEEAMIEAAAARRPVTEPRESQKALDDALTDATRVAYAAERAEIGPRGYDDWIYRRKAKAKPAARAWRAEAERLLTLRETYRVNSVAGVLRRPSVSRTLVSQRSH